MATFWKRLLRICGSLLILPGLPLAFGCLCVVPISAVSNSGNYTASIAMLTLTALTLGAGVVFYRQAVRSLKGEPTKDLRLPPLIAMVGVFVLLLAVGLFITQNRIVPGLFFPPMLLILATLPPLWAVAWFTSTPLSSPHFPRSSAENGGTEGAG